MSTRTDYSAEEWDAIRRTPAEAVVAIEQSAKAGFMGRRRERKATEKSFKEAIAQFAGLGLIDAIVAARDEEGVLIDAIRASDEPLMDKVVETAARARRALDAKATREEREAYVNTVLEAAEAVALATGERGDDSKVSQAESLLLRRIAAGLGRAGYEPPQDRWTAFDPAHRDQ
jgi:hypothetical protein